MAALFFAFGIESQDNHVKHEYMVLGKAVDCKVVLMQYDMRP